MNNPPQSLYNLLKILLVHIEQKRRFQLCLFVVLMVFSSFAEILTIGTLLPFFGVLADPHSVFDNPLVHQIFKYFNFSEAVQALPMLTLIFIGACFISGGIRLVLLWAQVRLSYGIGADLSVSIYRRTLYQPYEVHVARNSSEVISGIVNKANVVSSYTIMPVLTILNSGMLLIAILAILIILNPVVAITAIGGLGVIYGLIVILSKKYLSENSKKISVNSNQVMKTLQEGLGGIRDVLINGSQATYIRAYSDADTELRRAQANVQIIGIAPRYAVEAFGMILIAGLAYFMTQQESSAAKTIPILGALALGAQRLLPVLQQAYTSISLMRGGQAVLEDALSLLSQPLPKILLENSSVEPLSFQDEITIENLSFRYSPDGPWILRNVNMVIAKGQRVGFIGVTGSGKSTMMDLIMGLLKPTEGSIRVDGVTVTYSNQRAWQLNLAHVPQMLFLSDATVAENIAFGVPATEIDLEKVKIAAHMAQISDLIMSWNHQFSTRIGERGIKLSGGQRQRIGIARALYKSANVLIFDEATSSLDGGTEKAVMDIVNGLNKDVTVLIVAHRLTTLKSCTQIVEFEAGKIKRIGSYKELIDI